MSAGMTFGMKLAYPRLFRLGLIVCVTIIVADQVTKAIMLHILEQYRPPEIAILPFFSLVKRWNPGVSFSMLSNAGPLVLSGGAILVALALLVWLGRIETALTAIGIGCVAGGALGNVIDRLTTKERAVFDFLDLYIRTGSGWEWHWPAFNLADSGITIGVILLLFDGLFHRVDRAKTEHS
jgi:signal peptidase II